MEMNPDMAELIGAIIGDGSIYYSKPKYVEITGDLKNDVKYLSSRISSIVKNQINYSPRLYFRKDGSVRLRINNRSFVRYWKSLGLPTGARKSLVVTIPDSISLDWRLARACIRGIYDTDGSVYFDYRSIYRMPYPRVDLHLANISLIRQIARILVVKRFNPKVVERGNNLKSPITKASLYLNGIEQVRLFLKEVGF